MDSISTRSDLILLTPGPVRMPPLVREYLADPPCQYHRQDAFRAMFSETESDLKALVGIRDPKAYFATLLTSTGTGANESCLLALQRLGKGLIVRNGFFAARAVDQAVQNRIDHSVLDAPHDRPIDPDAVARAIAADRELRWLFFVAHETRTGLANPVGEIGRLAKERGLMVAADAISNAYAFPLDIEGAGLDVVVASSAKAIMAAPGIGIVFMRHQVAEELARRGDGTRSYYLDLLAEYQRQRADAQPRFAQPVALHAALRAACIHLHRVSVDGHMRRIRSQMDQLIEHLAGLGVASLLDPAHRSGIAVNFRLPSSLGYREFARRMEGQGYFVLYGIPGDETSFQLSTIGHLEDSEIAGARRALTTVLRP